MHNELIAIGLSDKEARVYLAALELGPSTVQEIARKAAVNRPTAYVQIESLTKRGLMSSVLKGKKHFFHAENPDQLTRLFDKSKKELKEKENDLMKALPQLKELFESAEEKPKVRFFEGKEGLITMQEDFLKTKEKTIYSFFSMDDVNNVFSKEEIMAYRGRREKKGIYAKGIYTRSEGPLASTFTLMDLKYVPVNNFPMKSDVTLYGSKLAIASLKGKLIGVIIENEEIAETFKSIFFLAWKAADT